MPLRTAVAWAAVALVARAGAAIVVGEAPYLDAAYYELVARRLAAGDGFTVPVLWSFLEVGGRIPTDPELPVPSNRHWMPLTSIVSALPVALLGPSRLVAQSLMIVLSAALVPLTAYVTWQLWRSRTAATAAGILALFAGPMLVLAPLIDNFAVFGIVGFGALYAATQAVRTPERSSARRWLVLSGALCGLATLARVDGVLLIIAPVVAWLVRRREASASHGVRALDARWLAVAVVAAAVVLSPWLMRQMLTFGSPFPSAGGHTLWITSYNEQFSVSRTFDVEGYLTSGLPEIVTSKLAAWTTLLGRTSVLLGGIFIAPFLYGLWRERRRADLAPFAAYWLLMFATMGGVFTLHAPHGAFYHSAPAWLPFAAGLSVASFMPMAASIGTRWRLLGKPRNRRFLFATAVAGAITVSTVGSAALLSGWREDRARLERSVPFFAQPDRRDGVVMYVNPPSLHLLTGNPSVAPPFDPYPVIGEAARAYHVRWVLLERPPGSASDPLGLWEGAEALDQDGNAASWLASEPAFEAEGIRVYEVVP